MRAKSFLPNVVFEARVDGDAVVRDEDVDAVARRRHGHDVLADRRHAAADERRDDDAALAAFRRVRMAARCAWCATHI